jgi:hypothetical protein
MAGPSVSFPKLTEELVRQRYKVVLFASGDSTMAAALVACVPQGLRLASLEEPLPYQAMQLEYLRQRCPRIRCLAFSYRLSAFSAHLQHRPSGRHDRRRALVPRRRAQRGNSLPAKRKTTNPALAEEVVFGAQGSG